MKVVFVDVLDRRIVPKVESVHCVHHEIHLILNHIFHLYTIKIEKDYHLSRNQLFQKLAKAGIGTSVQYNPLHLMSYYKKTLKINKNEFPNANKIKDQILCLPIYPNMDSKKIDYVIKNLN